MSHSMGVLCAVCRAALIPEGPCPEPFCRFQHGSTFQEPSEWAAKTWPDHVCFQACARCGEPATGLATIGDRRFCHGDTDTEPTCYEQEQWDLSGVRPDLTLLQNEARVFEEGA